MRANELRIGNWVYWEGEECSIVDFDAIKFAEEFTPVPLTEEWLLNFGALKDENGDLFIQDPTSELMRFYLINNEFIQWTKFDFCPIANYKHIKYVHQFQNLYFVLTGEELIVK